MKLTFKTHALSPMEEMVVDMANRNYPPAMFIPQSGQYEGLLCVRFADSIILYMEADGGRWDSFTFSELIGVTIKVLRPSEAATLFVTE